MSYVVVKSFTDLCDNRHIYHEGDVYPRDGYTSSEDRIAELMSSENAVGTALIRAVDEGSNKNVGRRMSRNKKLV